MTPIKMTYALTLAASLTTSITVAGVWFVRSLDVLHAVPDEDAAVPA